jgi:plastocyanin
MSRRPSLPLGVGVQAVLLALVSVTALAAGGACFSERQAATAPPGGTETCNIPVNSPIVGSTVAIVAIRNFGFHPQTVTVKPGTTVTWVNCEPEGIDAHTSTADGGQWDSPFLEPGATYSHTFSAAGTFDYHCIPHPSMQATVVVQ